MACHLLDPLFGWEDVDKIFSDHSRVQRMLDFEAGLARAEARAGIIPHNAVEPIVSKCQADIYDFDALSKALASAGNLAIPLIKQLTALISNEDKEAAGYVHWGATSQDVIDTGLVLQLRDALKLIANDLVRLCDNVASLADKYRATPSVARTWMQHAVPTVLGLKFAGWLDALNRHLLRLRGLQDEALVLQFGGAAGNLAALGDKGLEIATYLADDLSLKLPELPWHAHRDRIADVATTLALCDGTLGKIGRDLSLLCQTEVAEVFEPAGEGRGGSSTMPQKRNPVTAAVALAAAMRVPGLTSVMLSAMVQEHERGLGGWHAEWETLPEIIRLTAGALHHVAEAIGGLDIDAEQIRRNLDKTPGLVFAEAVMITLAKPVGRSNAHELLEEASSQAIAQKKHLRDVLKEHPKVTSYVSPEEIDRLFEPLSYSGVADSLIDRALAAYRLKSKRSEGK